MKFYEAYLKEQSYSVQYIDTTNERSDINKLIEFLFQQKVTSIHIADVVDYWLTKRIRAACKKHSIK